MDKPLVLRIEELKQNVVDDIAASKLPASIISLVLGQFISQAEYQTQLEVQQATKEWEKVNKEALQTEADTKEG